MDPCTELDDPLSERVTKFLASFQDHLQQSNKIDSRDPVLEPLKTKETPVISGVKKGNRKITVRLRDLPEIMGSPIAGKQPSGLSLAQTPLTVPVPFARFIPEHAGEYTAAPSTSTRLNKLGKRLRDIPPMDGPAQESRVPDFAPMPVTARTPLQVKTPCINPPTPSSEEKIEQTESTLLPDEEKSSSQASCILHDNV